jgi:acyl-coenzyme A thioesterase PaaI-like protein
MDQNLAKKMEIYLYEKLPLVEAVGCRVDELTPGHVKMSMLKSRIVTNHFGAFHAGALYTFAETVAGALLTSVFDMAKNTLIAKHGEISYSKMVTDKASSIADISQEEIERIKIEVTGKGRTEFRYTVIVKNQDDETACEVTFDFLLRGNKQNR